MTKIRWERTKKQSEALNYLLDNTTNEVLFGGGAGGAKSFLGCAWLLLVCLKYPGSRWVMAREVLARLKETTLVTFFEVCSMWGIKPGVHFTYNQFEGIKFINGSKILTKELFYYPSDPNFDGLGSLEITGAFVDEVNQVSIKGVNILKSRIRYKLDNYCHRCGSLNAVNKVLARDASGKAVKWKCLNSKCGVITTGLIPKVLFSCNPSKGWVYTDFYIPFKKGALPEHKRFVQALAGDNPFISKHYVENLKKLDKNTRERLLYGNWEYDDDPARLFEYDNLVDMFTNTGTPGEKYLSVDVARHGKDKTVIVYWNGWQIKKIWIIKKSGLDFVVETLGKICAKLQIQRSHAIVDEDGVGGGVVDTFKGCKGFLNNGRPIVTKKQKRLESKELFVQNYTNLKSQCYFYLATQVDRGTIGIDNVDDEVKEFIVEELAVVKQKDIDKENKLAIISKEDMKEILGRSPDFADAIMMRAYFDLRPQSSIKIHLV